MNIGVKGAGGGPILWSFQASFWSKKVRERFTEFTGAGSGSGDDAKVS